MTKRTIIWETKRLALSIWHKACEFDGIDPAALNAVLSLHNPYRAMVNRANALLSRTWVGTRPKLPR